MSDCCSALCWGAAWGLTGLAVLVAAEVAGGRDEPLSLTVGDLLLFVAVGAPFLPLVLLTLLCQVRLPPFAARKRQQQAVAPVPDFEREAALEVEEWLCK